MKERLAGEYSSSWKLPPNVHIRTDGSEVKPALLTVRGKPLAVCPLEKANPHVVKEVKAAVSRLGFFLEEEGYFLLSKYVSDNIDYHDHTCDGYLLEVASHLQVVSSQGDKYKVSYQPPRTETVEEPKIEEVIPPLVRVYFSEALGRELEVVYFSRVAGTIVNVVGQDIAMLFDQDAVVYYSVKGGDVQRLVSTLEPGLPLPGRITKIGTLLEVAEWAETTMDYRVALFVTPTSSEGWELISGSTDPIDGLLQTFVSQVTSDGSLLWGKYGVRAYAQIHKELCAELYEINQVLGRESMLTWLDNL